VQNAKPSPLLIGDQADRINWDKPNISRHRRQFLAKPSETTLDDYNSITK